MTHRFLLIIILTGGAGLIPLVAALIVLLRLERKARLFRERVSSVITAPGRKKESADAPGVMAANRAPMRSLAVVRVLTRAGRRSRSDLVLLGIILAVGLLLAFALTRYLSGFFGYFALPIIPLLPVLLSRSIFGIRDRRLMNAYRQQFPEALAIIARTVRVGVPVGEALRIVARESEEPTATEFTYLVNRIAIGVPLSEALHSSAERTGLTEHRLFATAVSLQSQTGGGLTETLINLAATIRTRLAARDRAHAMASEARTTAYILGGLPVVTGGLLALVNPHYVGVLFTDKSGNTILALACGSLLTGILVMRLIIQKTLA